MSKVVLCNGCFDPLHGGHVLHLKAARALGTKLVVSVTRNAFVNKGPLRPVFDEKIRMEMLSELRSVDDVVLVSSSLEALKLVRPQIFVKGIEYKGKLRDADKEYCEANGIEIEFTDEATYSSTDLLRRHDRIR